MTGIISPEFIAALAGVLASAIISLVPQFEAVRVELMAVIGVLVTAVILALGGERIAAARASGSTQAERLSAKAESLKVKSS